MTIPKSKMPTCGKSAIKTAKQTPYYLSTSGGNKVYFAFVPYDNQGSVSLGSPVYDC